MGFTRKQLNELLDLHNMKREPGPIQLNRIWKLAETRLNQLEDGGYLAEEELVTLEKHVNALEWVCLLARSLTAARNENNRTPKLIAAIVPTDVRAVADAKTKGEE